jgi:hypothetical protein
MDTSDQITKDTYLKSILSMGDAAFETIKKADLVVLRQGKTQIHGPLTSPQFLYCLVRVLNMACHVKGQTHIEDV